MNSFLLLVVGLLVVKYIVLSFLLLLLLAALLERVILEVNCFYVLQDCLWLYIVLMPSTNSLSDN